MHYVLLQWQVNVFELTQYIIIAKIERLINCLPTRDQSVTVSSAFRPLTEDPIIQAISLPFGGLGSAVILEQLFRSVG